MLVVQDVVNHWPVRALAFKAGTWYGFLEIPRQSTMYGFDTCRPATSFRESSNRESTVRCLKPNEINRTSIWIHCEKVLEVYMN